MFELELELLLGGNVRAGLRQQHQPLTLATSKTFPSSLRVTRA